MTKQLSIRDIAKLSGVSISTVSRVLNNTGRFSSKTKEKVLKICKEYGYQPNTFAQNLRTQKTAFIGIIVPDISNEFFANIVKNCENYLFKMGYLAIVCNTDRNSDLEKKYIEKLSNHMVAGFIVISANSKNIQSFNISLPTVYIDRLPAIEENNASISSDNYHGARIATNYLLELNAYPYMIVTPTIMPSTTEERIKGFTDVLRENGITNHNIISLNSTSDMVYSHLDEIKNVINPLIKKNKKIGIFAINDQIASAIVKVAVFEKIKIPDQLSIIGFDNTSIAKTSVLPLTTISQDTHKLSIKAVTTLIDLLSYKKVSHPRIIVPVKLIKRQTT